MRKLFYAIIVENKTHGLGTETNFDFKFIPNFDTTSTALGENVSGIKESGIERRNLKALVIASAVMGVVGYLCMRGTWGIVGNLSRSWWFT